MLNLFSILWGINVFLQRNYFTFLTESLKTLPSYSDLNRCPNFLEVWKPFGTKTEQILRWGLITKCCWVTPLLPQPRTPAFVKTCTGLPRQPPAIALIQYSRIVFSFLFDWDFIHKKILIWVFHQWEKIVLLLFQKVMLTIHYTNICSFATVTRCSWSILINFVYRKFSSWVVFKGHLLSAIIPTQAFSVKVRQGQSKTLPLLWLS